MQSHFALKGHAFYVLDYVTRRSEKIGISIKKKNGIWRSNGEKCTLRASTNVAETFNWVD